MLFAGLVELRDLIVACLGDTCEYKVFISLGEPPADCNSIALWYSSSSRNRSDNSDCITQYLDSTLNITITRCCVTADASPTFSPAQEQKDAECFYADFESLLTCLTCNDILDDWITSCGANISSIRWDNSKSGGCYSATISLFFTEEICCPVP